MTTYAEWQASLPEHQRGCVSPAQAWEAALALMTLRPVAIMIVREDGGVDFKFYRPHLFAPGNVYTVSTLSGD